MTKRDFFILRLALEILANDLEDWNDDYRDDDEESLIRVGHFGGTQVTFREVNRLIDLVEARINDPNVA